MSIQQQFLSNRLHEQYYVKPYNPFPRDQQQKVIEYIPNPRILPRPSYNNMREQIKQNNRNQEEEQGSLNTIQRMHQTPFSPVIKRPTTVSPYRLNIVEQKGVRTSLTNNEYRFYEKEQIKTPRKMKYFVKSIAGSIKQQPKINQDSFFIADGFCGYKSSSIFMVLDGHGQFGHIVSSKAQNIIYQLLEVYFKKIDLSKITDVQIAKGFVDCIKDTEIQLLASGVDITMSGSTMVCVLLIDQNVWCINIGDSRAVVVSDNFTTVYELSKDHKPDNSAEKVRILKSGGRVSPVRNANGQPIGPLRVWVKNQTYPGLAMSRSLGDTIAHQVGVTTQPDIISHKIQAKDQFIVIGSDGMWEQLDNKTITRIIRDNLDKGIETITETLIQRSVQQAQKAGDLVDDITCILIKLN